MSHPYPVHGVAYATTGLPEPKGEMESAREIRPIGRSSAPWSITWTGRSPAARKQAARCRAISALPFPLSTPPREPAAPVGAVWRVPRPGVRSDLDRFSRAAATSRSCRAIAAWSRSFAIPTAASRPIAAFNCLAASTAGDLTLDRLDRRRSLLDQLDDARGQLDADRDGTAARPPPGTWPSRCSAREPSAKRST